ncbi:MAG: hypothetical protein C0467_23485 [Planctomycetaceae bacterium]|nr:hypothetical protein [Planctomycetaceae bacterium]
MKRKLMFAGVIATFALSAQHPVAADPPALPIPKPPAAKAIDWKDDPVCQMVFFAVLEGLYRDGVTDDVVEYIVPKTPNPEKDSLRKNFIPECPICHPVYEAFALYQRRPNFKDDGKRNAFGKGELSPEIVKAFKSDILQTRVKEGIQPLVGKYVAAHLAKMNLSAEEKQEWSKKLMERVEQGTSLYNKFRAGEGRLLGWSFYGGCGACLGTAGACKTVLAEKKPEK